jgi:elongation factor P--(R)-beta-lysine ligase
MNRRQSIRRHTGDDFRPTASWNNLQLRAELLRRLRRFFDERGFLEVETPILSADTVVDRHLDPFSIDIHPSSFILHHSAHLYLQTSPEFAMKRLLAAGGEAIYQVARVFRQGELGPLHNPEFTMVEWYQPGVSMEEGTQLTGDLCETMLGPLDRSRGEKGGQAPFVQSTRRAVPANGACPPFSPAERLSYREAFERCVGIDPHTADGPALAAVSRNCGIEPPASLSLEDRDGWLDLLMVERVQPNLGFDRPVILCDYPASQAALARIRPGDPPVAERFELFVRGIELANGYHELLDPAELRARNDRVNAQRTADGKPPLPTESRLLQAMEAGLPSAVGVALGFDRLVMLAAGAKSIAEVIAFPFDRA